MQRKAGNKRILSLVSGSSRFFKVVRPRNQCDRGAGSVVVTANQAGDSNYTAAAPVSHTITVTKATTAAGLKSSAASII
jgi:hypothetical protein